MFKWLFGTKPSQLERFEQGYDLLTQVSSEVRDELNKIRDNPKVADSLDLLLNNYRDITFLESVYNGVIVAKSDNSYRDAFLILPTVSIMYVTVVENVLGHSGNEFFPNWLNNIKIDIRDDALRIAYILTSIEQLRSGEKSVTSIASRVILGAVATAVHPNGHELSKKYAELFRLSDDGDDRTNPRRKN